MLSYVWTMVLLVFAISTEKVSNMQSGGLLSEAVRRDQVKRDVLPPEPVGSVQERAAPYRFYNNNTRSEWSF